MLLIGYQGNEDIPNICPAKIMLASFLILVFIYSTFVHIFLEGTFNLTLINKKVWG